MRLKKGDRVQIHGPEINGPGTPDVYMHGECGTVASLREHDGFVRVQLDNLPDDDVRVWVGVLRLLPAEPS